MCRSEVGHVHDGCGMMDRGSMRVMSSNGMMRPRCIQRMVRYRCLMGCRCMMDTRSSFVHGDFSVVSDWSFMLGSGMVHRCSDLVRCLMVRGNRSVVSDSLGSLMVHWLSLNMLLSSLHLMMIFFSISVMDSGELVFDIMAAIINIESRFHKLLEEGLWHLDVLDTSVNFSRLDVGLLWGGHVSHLRLVVLTILRHLDITRPGL